uniref:Uncharacterized protein n=1 Tax=Arundo donax TaxID=35708 RepID=A0A0A9BD94_ARUDO
MVLSNTKWVAVLKLSLGDCNAPNV